MLGCNRSGRRPLRPPAKCVRALRRAECLAAGAEFGQHAAADDCVFGERGDLIDSQRITSPSAPRTPGTSVRKTSALACAAHGAGGGHLVRVDVVILAVEAESHAGEHRHRSPSSRSLQASADRRRRSRRQSRDPARCAFCERGKPARRRRKAPRRTGLRAQRRDKRLC